MSGLPRPIEPEEVPFLLRLGAAVVTLRSNAGIMQKDVAWAAQIQASTLCLIEKGRRRTRRSTLTRIVESIAMVDDSLDVDATVDDLVALAGPALAPPSRGELRAEKRRGRRSKRQDAIEARARELAAQMVREHLAAEARPSGRERRRLMSEPVPMVDERRRRAARRREEGR